MRPNISFKISSLPKIAPQALLTLLSLAVSLLVLLLLANSVLANSPAHAITRGYLSNDTELQPGMLVKLSDDSDADHPKVDRASLEKADRIIGVATTIKDSSVAIVSAEQSVYVETTGEVNAYVSDMNGEVKKGDLLIVSPLGGILAKYIPDSSHIFALALEDASSQSSEAYDIQSPDGQKKTTNLTLIKVNLDQKSLAGDKKEPSALEKLGQSVTGKQVNQLRVLVALVIFIIVLIVEGAILYGSISSAVTSIGRNPLASKVIKRELIRIMMIALLSLMVGLGSVYLVLWA